MPYHRRLRNICAPVVNTPTAGLTNTVEPSDIVEVKRALLSVSDKEGLVELGQFLASQGVELISTGGSAAALRDAGLDVMDASDVTGHPECLDGRVKTLHPKIHGGILSIRNSPDHEAQISELGIEKIDLVVVNLYPFEATVASGADYATCVENIDIGGPAMLRAAAKNHAGVLIVTDPSDYGALIDEMQSNGGSSTSFATRKKLAAKAYARSAEYDAQISAWYATQLDDEAPELPAVTRVYEPEFALKYGNNPHQTDAAVYSIAGQPLPFTVLNGTPGYINLLDAMNSFQLAVELRAALDLPAAASFKHVSPAGAAVAVPLTDDEHAAYEIGDRTLTPASLAYVRARHADPLCSFGDWAALSDVVDEETADFLRTEVSDGIIAPGYTEAALAILAKKKGGSFIVLQGDAAAIAASSGVEYREVGGAVFAQSRNDVAWGVDLLDTVVTPGSLTEAEKRDLVVASIACKYTQSNSVVYAINGQTVGVGAGQQSRVDCVKLAGRKVDTWWLRQHPKVQGLQFVAGTKRQDRVNARVAYIDGVAPGSPEEAAFLELLAEAPESLTDAEKAAWVQDGELNDVCVSSDAFFPFRDSIDQLARHGVRAIVQPGGSVQDEGVTEACNEYGMIMAHSGVRLFHH